MDDRLIFLYCRITELWGRMWRARARNGKPRTSEVAAAEKTPQREDVTWTEE